MRKRREEGERREADKRWDVNMGVSENKKTTCLCVPKKGTKNKKVRLGRKLFNFLSIYISLILRDSLFVFLITRVVRLLFLLLP